MLSLCCVFVGASHFMVFSQNVNFTPRCALYIQSITTHICTHTKSLVEQLASGNYNSHMALKRETRILFISFFFPLCVCAETLHVLEFVIEEGALPCYIVVGLLDNFFVLDWFEEWCICLAVRQVYIIVTWIVSKWTEVLSNRLWYPKDFKHYSCY